MLAARRAFNVWKLQPRASSIWFQWTRERTLTATSGRRVSQSACVCWPTSALQITSGRGVSAGGGPRGSEGATGWGIACERFPAFQFEGAELAGGFTIADARQNRNGPGYAAGAIAFSIGVALTCAREGARTAETHQKVLQRLF